MSRSCNLSPQPRSLSSFLLTALLLASGLEAQSPSPSQPELELEVTVVATTPDLAEEDHPREELGRVAPDDIAKALRFSTGVDAIRRGPINLDPTVRGLTGDQLAITVDGTRTFASGPGRMDSAMSHVDLQSVDRVVVVKGPYALTFGPGALSAIDVRTPTPEFGDGSSTRAGLSAETNIGATELFGSHTQASERLEWGIFLGAHQGDDYEDGSGNEVPADYESANVDWRVATPVGDSGRFSYRGSYHAQDDIDYAGRQLDATYFRARAHNLRFERTGTSKVRGLFLQLYSNRKDHRMNNDEKPSARDMPGRIPPFALDVDLPTEANTAGARGHVDLEAGPWSFRLGADHLQLDQEAERTIRRRASGMVMFYDRVWPAVDTTMTGAFGRATWQNDSLQVSGTVRGDRFDAEAETSEFFRSVTSDTSSYDEDALSAAVSARFQLADGWLLSGGLGRVVRAPGTLELISDRFPSTLYQVSAEFLGNPDLEAETATQADLGVAYQSGDVQVTLDLFHRDLDDFITIEPAPGVPKRLPASPTTVRRFVNGDQAESYGGELRFRQRLNDLLSWSLSYEIVRGTDQDLDEPLLGMPADTGRLGFRIAPPAGHWWGEAELQVTADQDRVSTTRLEQATPGYELVDLRAGWRLAERWSLMAAVNNLFDEAYARHLNTLNPFTRERIQDPGRSVRLGVRWTR